MPRFKWFMLSESASPDDEVTQHQHVHFCTKKAIQGFLGAADDRFIFIK